MNRAEVILDDDGNEVKESLNVEITDLFNVPVYQEKIRNNFIPQSINDETNGLAGPLELSPSGKLLRKYILTEGFGDHHIEVYDKWIFSSSHHNVYGKQLTLPGNKVVCFENLHIFPPRYTKDGKVFRLTPKLAREQGITYGGDWQVDITIRKDNRRGELLEKKSGICIGTVPTMLKSQHCILHGKSSYELALFGEDPEDPGGYFVVSGIEKVVLLQERLVVNKIFLMDMDSKGATVARLTANTIRGTALIELALDKKTKSIIKMRFPSMREPKKKDKNNSSKGEKYKSLNVLRIFRLLGLQTPDSIKEFISMFMKPEHVKKCMLKLTRNFVEFTILTDDVGIILTKMDKNNLSSSEKDAEITRILEADLFPNLNEFQGPDGETQSQRDFRIKQAKAYMLGIMVARFLEHIAGYRELDDRDSWSNKRTDGAGRMMEQLFRNAWRKTLGIAQAAIEGGTRDLHGIIDKLHASIITDTFHDSFITSNWGVRGTQVKNNVAQTLVRDSVIATYAHINTIDVSISRTVRKQSLRLMQNSQYGFVCPASTPEGENAGLLKNLCITAKVSLERSEKEIIRFLIGDVQKGMNPMTTMDYRYSNVWKDKILVDGKPLGWCDGDAVQKFLITMRRQGRLPSDMSVVRDDGWIYVDISPSRLVRPLLIVNEDQKLVIDTIVGAREVTNHILLTNGCMEYISAWEQEYIKVATSEDKIKKRLDDIEDAEETYRAVVADLEAIEEGNIIFKRNKPEEILSLAEANEDLIAARRALTKAKASRPYTHCELDSLAILGVAASIIPWPNHNQAPRNTYQVSMGKQALGDYHSNHLNRFDGKMKTLVFPNRPMVETEMYDITGLTRKGTGENVNGAFVAAPYTEEDAFCIKREFLDNGGFRMHKYLTYKTVVKHHSGEVTEELTRPEPRENEQPATRYNNIQMYEKNNPNNGLPKLGAYLNQGDCIIGKVQHVPSAGEIRNESVILRVGDEGIVEKVLVTTDNKTTVVVVKLRIMRVPEEGDKYAPRNAQKGTAGLILSDIDMVYDENGDVPDIYMNPHCFAADTNVTLKCGLSRPLTRMKFDGGDKVWSLNPENGKFVSSVSLGYEGKGVRDIVKVTFSDGRVVRCTPDHKFPVIRDYGMMRVMEKLPIAEVTREHTFLASFDSPVDDPSDEDMTIEKEWYLHLGEYSFDMSGYDSRDRAMAFARLLGMICTDGCLSESPTGSFTGNIVVGTYIDADNVLDDLQLVTGKRPAITAGKSESKGSTLCIMLPGKFARALAKLEGMIIGRKTREIPEWPEFLFTQDCPKSMVREFLAAAFGGDGWCPYLTTNKQDGPGTVTFNPPAFSQSTTPEQADMLIEKMSNMAVLFSKVGVDGIRINPLKKYVNDFTGKDMVSCSIQLPRGTEFGDNVGFRYCVQKSYRLAAYQSYMRYLSNVKRQNDFIIQRANEIYESGTGMGPGRKTLQKALDASRIELFQRETPFNEYYSNATMDQLANRRRPNRHKELLKWDYSRIEDAEVYLRKIGVYHWFRTAEGLGGAEYIIGQKDMDMPGFRLNLHEIRHVGREEVFDIGVDVTHTIIGSGVGIFQCMPSRMTISYLNEMIASKAGAVKGVHINGGAFKPFPLAQYRQTLRERNREVHGDELKREHEFGYEFMKSGTSGRKLDVPVYSGPVFFQALKHHVKDKVQARGTGQFKPMTRQPPKGRGNRGGLRFGEMERDAAISHGASAFLMERLMHVSDAYQTAFCRICGQFAVNAVNDMNDTKTRKYKPCRLCGNADSFGRCTIPYVYKLLIHLLAAPGMNLSPELLTSDEYLEKLLSKRDISVGDIANIREGLDEADAALGEEQKEIDRPDDELGEDYYD